MTDPDPLAIPCPVCGPEIGAPCVRSGVPLPENPTRVHVERAMRVGDRFAMWFRASAPDTPRQTINFGAPRAMSDPIAPALTVDQWREARDYLASKSAVPLGERAAEIASDVSGMVAILNDALPDDHPRKITREWIQMLRETAEEYDYLTPIADALASYLPPETP